MSINLPPETALVRAEHLRIGSKVDCCCGAVSAAKVVGALQGFPGTVQPTERLSEALKRHEGYEGGLLVAVPRTAVAAATESLASIGLKRRFWDNATPPAPHQGRLPRHRGHVAGSLGLDPDGS